MLKLSFLDARGFHVALGALLVAACGSGSSGGNDTPHDEDHGPPGVSVGDETVLFRTEEFTLEPGEEKFLCYATTLEEGFVINGYSHEGAQHLHHVVFSRAGAPEPEGFSECDVLFRPSWEPLYLTGTGTAGIEFPEGLGHDLKEGEQLVAQLHLLNASTKSVTSALEIDMRRAQGTSTRPIGSYVFGTLGVNLPGKQASMLEGTCTLDEDVELIAAFPHMHYLGKALTFEAGPSEDAMEMLFSRDPYDFDNQYIELFDLKLSPGDVARTRCLYENPYDETITFGESTKNEMCFFIGFAADKSGVNSCLFGSGDVGDPVPVDPAAGICGEHTPTADGLGLACTANGNECPTSYSCTAEFSGQDEGICIKLGCETSEDCGGGFNTCCTPPQSGGALNICVPEACRQPSCVPQ